MSEVRAREGPTRLLPPLMGRAIRRARMRKPQVRRARRTAQAVTKQQGRYVRRTAGGWHGWCGLVAGVVGVPWWVLPLHGLWLTGAAGATAIPATLTQPHRPHPSACPHKPSHTNHTNPPTPATKPRQSQQPHPRPTFQWLGVGWVLAVGAADVGAGVGWCVWCGWCGWCCLGWRLACG